ncbi:MAG TPA: alpha/beta hydrolase [Candidatus Acidoferrales bacterium]
MRLNLIAPLAVVLVAALICVACIVRIRSLQRKNYGKWRRIAEISGLAVMLLFAASLGAGAAFNAAASQYFFSRHPAPGKLYEVGGYQMHLNCTGQGSPTVVLDAGLGNDSLIWDNVQPELSKITEVCSYDRSGFGWSETRPGPRDARRLNDELHGLLNAAGVQGPVILMGHSISGMYIRDYAARYPQNLVGLVFVDGSTPLQDARFPAEIQLAEEKTGADLRKLEWLSVLGLRREMGGCAPEEGFSKSAAKLLAEDQCRTSVLAAAMQELGGVVQSGDETIHTGPFGDLPILIFSQDPVQPATPGISAETGKAVSKTWNEMQEDLKKLSTRSRRIIAKGSSHFVQIDRVGMLNAEVGEFIRQVRGEVAERTDYGSTKVE